MKMIQQILLMVICGSYSLIALAVTDIYQLDSVQQQRFQALTQQLRCLVCQNESLADSNAPLAADLRQTIATQMKQGATNQAIIHYLVTRYGNYVLYQPPLSMTTVLLWFLPAILILLALLLLWFMAKKYRSSQTVPLNVQQQQRLQTLLTQNTKE